MDRLSGAFPCFLLLPSILLVSPAPASSQGTNPPRPIEKKNPTYPKTARELGVSGVVSFVANVTQEGTVSSVRVIEVPQEDMGFEGAVEDAVSRWRFEPAQHDGVPVASAYTAKISFTLNPGVEKAIQEFVTRAVALWKKGDSQALGGLFDPAGVLIHGHDDWAQGPPGITEKLTRLMNHASPIDPEVSTKGFHLLPHGALAWAHLRVAFSTIEGTERKVPISLLLSEQPERWWILSAEWWSDDNVEMEMPRKVLDAFPSYPPNAKRKRVQGTVVCVALIDIEGKPSDVRVIRSIPELDEAAVEAVGKWRYEPVKRDGAPVPVWVTVTVSFILS